MTREDKIYEEQYGHIPDDQLDRVTYILGKKADNKKYNDMIMAEAKKVQKIKTTRLKFTMWKIVKPSARPRFNRRGAYIRTYVPHARENGDWFEEFAKQNNLPKIETPRKRTGDFDNYAKGIADCIQHGMLKDDCLVIESTQKLYYSIKPHAEIEIIYYNKHPDDVIVGLKR